MQHLRRLGLATDEGVEQCEANGRIDGARPELVGELARRRGADQCGTVGSGNHFVEVQVVERVEDRMAAAALGLEEGSLTVLIHSGSRGLGYQVCDDCLRGFQGVPERYGMSVPDRQLACAPIDSPEGQAYLGASRLSTRGRRSPRGPRGGRPRPGAQAPPAPQPSRRKSRTETSSVTSWYG